MNPDKPGRGGANNGLVKGVEKNNLLPPNLLKIVGVQFGPNFRSPGNKKKNISHINREI